MCRLFVCPNVGRAAKLRIFNVHADVNACDCTRVLYEHRKSVSTEG